MSEVIELFSIPVYKTKINISESDLEFCNTCRKNTRQNTYGNFASIDTFVLNNIAMSELKSKVNSEIQYYSDNIMGITDDVKLNITQSWFNYNDTDSSHHTHMHENSIVSGVIYFSESPSDIVFFREETSTSIKLRPKIKTHTKFNTPTLNLSVNKFDMILFPSNAWHGVNKNSSSDTRISLSFNTFYSGILGDNHSMTLLEIK